jgi:hypothetical protein
MTEKHYGKAHQNESFNYLINPHGQGLDNTLCSRGNKKDHQQMERAWHVVASLDEPAREYVHQTGTDHRLAQKTVHDRDFETPEIRFVIGELVSYFENFFALALFDRIPDDGP